jgi:hypothetical protein
MFLSVCPLVRLGPNKPQCSRHSIGKPGQAAELRREPELENKAWWPWLGTKLSLQFASHREFLPKQPTYIFLLYFFFGGMWGHWGGAAAGGESIYRDRKKEIWDIFSCLICYREPRHINFEREERDKYDE